MNQADIGLAVMGQNLVRNMAGHGFTAGVVNRTAAKADEFLLKGRAPGGCLPMESARGAWRRAAAVVSYGIPIPLIARSLEFFDGYRRGWLPANLIQAQRDFFGAHLYERTDRPHGEFFHTDWTGRGGDTTSTAYSA
jgi:6-phosphogluconate dehydrogenase